MSSMAPAISIQHPFAPLSPYDQRDVEQNLNASAKTSTSSFCGFADQGSERDAIVGEVDDVKDDASNAPVKWSRNHLLVAFAFLWAALAVASTFSNVLDALGPYIASYFNLHSFAAATGIVASIVGGLCTVPTSKLIGKFGRAQGIAFMLSIWIVGLVMLAACQNIPMYAAAQVFASVGGTGVTYCISVFVADQTPLWIRGFAMSFSTSPDIFTMWIGGPIATNLLTGIGWRWGFGIFAFALPLSLTPLMGLMLWNHRKIARVGLVRKKSMNEEASAFDTIKRFLIEVDAAGLLILATGLSLFLLAFTLYSFQRHGFDSPLIISFISVGLFLLIVYVLYEKYVAPTTSLPFKALSDYSVILAFSTMILSIIAFTNTVGYLTSYLQVVTSLSITQTSYLMSSVRVIMCVWSLLIGGLVSTTGHLKYLNLVFGIPPIMVASGLFIHFLHPDKNNLGVMVVIIVLMSCSLGSISVLAMLHVMAVLGDKHNATIIASITFLGAVAPAFGEAINTGIWTGTFKQALRSHLRGITDEEVKAIYSSLSVQLSFEKGSPTRLAIAESYADAKLWMLIVSLILMGLAFVCTLFWRDVRVKEVKHPSITESEV